MTPMTALGERSGRDATDRGGPPAWARWDGSHANLLRAGGSARNRAQQRSNGARGMPLPIPLYRARTIAPSAMTSSALQTELPAGLSRRAEVARLAREAADAGQG